MAYLYCLYLPYLGLEVPVSQAEDDKTTEDGTASRLQEVHVAAG